MRKNQQTQSKHTNNSRRRAFPRRKPYVIAILVMALAAAFFLSILIVFSILPSDLTLILAVTVLALLALACFMFSSRYRWKRIVGIVVGCIFITVLATTTGYMASTFQTIARISDSAVDASGPRSIPVNVTDEPFNVYITGIDQWEDEKGLDLERSDVNMVVTVNPVTKKILLTSIPRDSYVKLHSSGQMDKLTHTGIYGVDETLNTVQDWLGVDMNYYLKMNFTAARDIINAIGGIRVYSPVAFDSSLKDYHYEKGWNDLGGRAALYFARERHAFEGEDTIRVENQQRVMKATMKKMLSSKTLLTKYGDIMEVAGDNLSTSMSAEEMIELVRMQLTELASWDIETQKFEGDYDMDYVASLTQSHKFSVYKNDPKSVSKCVAKIKEVMDPPASELQEAEKNRGRSFVVNVVKSTIDRARKNTDEEDEEDKANL